MKAAALLLLLPMLVGCASRTAVENVEPVPYIDDPSAKMLEAPPCPAEVLAGIDGIDARDDWREVEGPQVRFCVPAHWQTRGSGLGASWYSKEGSLMPGWDRSINTRFGSGVRGGDSGGRGFATHNVGGATAEFFWMSRQQVADQNRDASLRSDRIPGDRSVRSDFYARGYDSYAVWRQQGFYFSGGTAERQGIAMLQRIYRTLRFDPRASGQ